MVKAKTIEQIFKIVVEFYFLGCCDCKSLLNVNIIFIPYKELFIKIGKEKK